MKKSFLTFAVALPCAAFAQVRYNVLYIMTDDHTAQMMSCYDRTHVSTPNLDRIAQDGVRFVNSYVANSLSGPSRACMITGKHSHANGFTNNEHGIFDGSQQTMPKLLQAAGYSTALIGKWHLVSTPTGFDHYEIIPGQGEYYNPTFITMDGNTHVEKGYLTNLLTDKAIAWLEDARQARNDDGTQRPFALFLHEKACHRDWLPELKYLREYEDVTFKLPHDFDDSYEGREAAADQEMNIASDHDMTMDYDVKMFDPQHPTRLTDSYLAYIGRLDSRDRAIYDAFYDSLAIDFRSRHLTGRALKEFKYQRFMRDYAKVLKTFDDNMGRLLDYLDRTGLSENTLVVYTSDQGFYMGEHGWFDKRFMYEESFNTPLVMRMPTKYHKPVAHGDITEMVQNIDYAPTFLDLAGAPIPADMHGRSLLPLLEGQHPKDWRKAVYYHYYEYPAEHKVRRHYGIATADGWKLMHFYPTEAEDNLGEKKIDAWEMYNLNADPGETHNLYGQPGTEKQLRRLRKELKQLQQQYADPILQTYPIK